MADNQDCPPFLGYISHFPQALFLESRIPHDHNFIHQQYLQLQRSGHSESQAHVHSAGIPLHRRIDEQLHTRKIHNFIELTSDFSFLQSQDGVVQINIFSPGQFRAKTGPHLQQAGEYTVSLVIRHVKV